MADALERLLADLIERELADREATEAELVASPDEPGETTAANRELARERVGARLDALGPAFAAGLRAAYAVHRAGQPELTLDDRQPDENLMADALVQALVRTDLAASRAEETEPSHYRYHLRVDWDRLARLAADRGLDLDAELARS
ncbi:MAG TPA: hypothetical protein VFW96_09575 [Thermomicrobiales bacterium]|nr:hypothetical protein [Thermomicrobiales bacterium]